MTNYACNKHYIVKSHFKTPPCLTCGQEKIMPLKCIIWKKVGKDHVHFLTKTVSLEFQPCFSIGLEGKHSCKTTLIKSTHHFWFWTLLLWFNSDAFKRRMTWHSTCKNDALSSIRSLAQLAPKPDTHSASPSSSYSCNLYLVKPTIRAQPHCFEIACRRQDQNVTCTQQATSQRQME